MELKKTNVQSFDPPVYAGASFHGDGASLMGTGWMEIPARIGTHGVFFWSLYDVGRITSRPKEGFIRRS